MKPVKIIRYLQFAAVAAMLALGTAKVGATVIGPYTSDTNTLHLWHLDETSGVMADSGSGTNIPMSPHGTNIQGASAYAGFGNSLNINTNTGKGAWNTTDGLLQTNWQGADGSFTYEALINVTNLSVTQTIINRDDSSVGTNMRSFAFCITAGTLKFASITDNGQVTATIPTNVVDTNCFVPNEWFHVAVVYCGQTGVANNVTLYWTRVQDSALYANAIGLGAIPIGVGSTYSDPSEIGYREATPGLQLLGVIDEIRISSIARSRDDFIFFDPSPHGVRNPFIKPYTSDANTLHLWHLDERYGVMADSGSDTNIPMSTYGTFPIQGAYAYPGFGQSLYIKNASTCLGAHNATAGLLQTNWQGADGSFTYEALINVTNLSVTQIIINRDDGDNPRSFGFNIGNGLLTFAGISGGSAVSATIPTNVVDTNCFVSNEWFHVAVTYNGQEGVASNVTFYWTRLQASALYANKIGSDTFATDIDPAASDRSEIGYREASAGLWLLGFIDEIRISSIARSSNGFIFCPKPAGTIVTIR